MSENENRKQKLEHVTAVGRREGRREREGEGRRKREGGRKEKGEKGEGRSEEDGSCFSASATCTHIPSKETSSAETECPS